MGADTSVSAHRVPRSGTSWWENAVGLIDRAMFAAPKGPPVPGEVPETGVAPLGRWTFTALSSFDGWRLTETGAAEDDDRGPTKPIPPGRTTHCGAQGLCCGRSCPS